MSAAFTIDLRDLRKLERFFKAAPQLIKPVTANVLTSLAFKTREYDIQNLSASMIIRNPGFMKSSLKVDKATSTRIENQIARAYSINRPNFTGWEEQEKGKTSPKHRAGTIHARKGNIRNTMMARARFKAGNKFYRPSQFQGKNRQQSFYFMMRVLGTRGTSEFLLTEDMPLKNGVLNKGLYQLKNHRIRRLQKLGSIRQPKRILWRTASLRSLRVRNDVDKIWIESIKRIMQRYK